MGSSPRVLSSTVRKRRKLRAPFERRVTRFSILLVAPGILVSGILIWLQTWSLQSKLVLFGAEAIACLLIGATLHDHVVRPLQTLANVVGALRDEDYSFRARMAAQRRSGGTLARGERARRPAGETPLGRNRSKCVTAACSRRGKYPNLYL